AQKFIQEGNYAVDSAPVKRLMDAESMIPSVNTFSDILAPLGFDMFPMAVVDIMHEVELGMWRSLFIHLLRILESAGPTHSTLTSELDRQYWQVPTFSRDTIRKFSANCSEMKQLAAHDRLRLPKSQAPLLTGVI
ncbi:hypothetical protein L208DRAFT_1313429, partial [Tricholoma matsutake]